MKLKLPNNPIRWTAIIVVALVAGYAMYMTYWMTDVLAGSGWCAKAIGADRADTDSRIDVAGSCVGLLTIQLKSLATNSHIFVGMFALVLLVLIVIVIAGGKLDVDLPEKLGGGGIHMGRGEPAPVTPEAKAATKTATAAVEAATAVAEAAGHAQAAPGEQG